MSQTNNIQPPQEQERQPGRTAPMEPHPRDCMEGYRAAGKLQGRKALITGGDSGIGRAAAIAFAKEGADVAFAYLEEDKDADLTREKILNEDRRCVTLKGDIGSRQFCDEIVERTVSEFNGLDLLVNNAAEQHPVDSLEELSDEQLLRTFQTNLFPHFYLMRAALKHMKEGSTVICTTSVTAYDGHPGLIDYASTKGAIVSFIRSMSKPLAQRQIRVNGVAPGPIWTPLIPASFPEDKVAQFGGDTPLGRPGQPDEVAPSYVFLASDDSSYITGQILHPNGGRPVSG